MKRKGKKKNPSRRPFAVAVLMAAVVGIWFLVEGEKETSLKEKDSTAAQEKESKGSVVTVSEEIQAKTGITTADLKSASHQETLRAYGRVVQLQNLVQLRSGYIREKNRLEKVKARVTYSKKEYDRLKALNADDANVSARTLEEGEANWRADEADLRAAEEALAVLQGGAKLEWGPVIARWLFEGAPALQKLIHFEDVLVQLTLPPGRTISPVPEKVSLLLPDGSLVSAGFLSPSPRTDPRIQGISLFYITPVRANLLSGMEVVVDLPVGAPMKGAFVPQSAVVWRDGAAWVYVQRGEAHFVRLRAPTEYPVKDGYFVLKVIEPGARVVVKGASLLMSAEFLAGARVGEED